MPQGINLWIDETTYNAFGYGFFIDNLDIAASLIAAVLVTALVLFSQYTKQGRAMRAVADDHQAALSVGISLRSIWVIVWTVAGYTPGRFPRLEVFDLPFMAASAEATSQAAQRYAETVAADATSTSVVKRRHHRLVLAVRLHRPLHQLQQVSSMR